MNDADKKTSGKFYKIDEERNLIIYDPSCNNYGKFDLSINDTVKNMVEIAQKTDMSVEAKFNKSTFQIMPKMTIEQGLKAFEEGWVLITEEHKNSPEYKAISAAQKIRQANDDKLIQNEEYNAEGHKLYFDYLVAQSIKDFNMQSVNYATRWAKLMQAEMKKQGLLQPTPEIVEDTQKRANVYGKFAAHNGADLLMATWKYGVEAADAMGYDRDDAILYRTARSDRAMQFYDKYKTSAPKNEDEVIKKSGQILATILQDETLIEQFHKRVENGSKEIVEVEKMRSYIPILDIPRNGLYILDKACDFATAQVKAVRTKTVEKSKSGPEVKK